MANVQTDAGPANAGQDDQDRSVSVCGDEAVPIERRVRKKVKECWSAAASRKPGIDHHVRVIVVVDASGKVTKTDLAQGSALGAEATACIQSALRTYKLDGSKCAGKTVSFDETFGVSSSP